MNKYYKPEAWAKRLRAKLERGPSAEEVARYTHSKMYGLTQIQLKGRLGSVTVLPMNGSTTKSGARWYRAGLRSGFKYFDVSVIQSPTKKYEVDFRIGVREGRLVAAYLKRNQPH